MVLDNGGGGIFGFLPPSAHEDVFEELFMTPLGLRFDDVARLYGLAYSELTEPAELDAAFAGALAGERSVLFRAAFSLEDSVRGHRSCWAAVARSIRSARPAAPGA